MARTGLESDISLYNRLGTRNSALLAAYARIDVRVRILGFMAKRLAKCCRIGDASRGSLASYAYTLLVLHYLQQVKPPIIPVLQEVAFAFFSFSFSFSFLFSSIGQLSPLSHFRNGMETTAVHNGEAITSTTGHGMRRRHSPQVEWSDTSATISILRTLTA